MDCSLPDSSVHLTWNGTIPFSRGSSQCRDETQSPTLQADALPAELPGNKQIVRENNKSTIIIWDFKLFFQLLTEQIYVKDKKDLNKKFI